MIYLFTGDDAKAKRASYEKFIKSLPKGEETFFINKNTFDQMQAESLFLGRGLFFARCTVFFENIFEREENLDFILGKLNIISESQNDFVFLEGKLKKIILDAFKKSKNQIYNFELAKEKKEKYNNFLLADAFGMRDKKNLWLHARFAMDRGVRMEELVGILFWKAKDMILKKNFSKFKETELKNFAEKISYLLPEAREKRVDDESAFEQFLLESF